MSAPQSAGGNAVARGIEMDNKVLDEAVEVARLAYEVEVDGRVYSPNVPEDAMRAALLAGVKVLLGPVVAEWRIPPTHKSAFAIQQHSAIRRCADELESIYAPSLGEGDGR